MYSSEKEIDEETMNSFWTMMKIIFFTGLGFAAYYYISNYWKNDTNTYVQETKEETQKIMSWKKGVKYKKKKINIPMYSWKGSTAHAKCGIAFQQEFAKQCVKLIWLPYKQWTYTFKWDPENPKLELVK